MISANKAFSRAICANNSTVKRELRVIEDQIKQASALGNYYVYLHDMVLEDATVTTLHNYGYEVDYGENGVAISWTNKA